MAHLINTIPNQFNLTQFPLPPLIYIGGSESVSICDFEILTLNLSDAKKATILERISALEEKEVHFAQVVDLVETRNYETHADFFYHEQFEYYALAAVYDGKISSMQFGTLMFVRAALLEPGIKASDLQAVPLFHGEAPATDAWDFITATLKPTKPRFIFEPSPAIGQQELAQFFEIMRTLPLSEQSFVLIPDLSDPVANRTISHEVSERLNVFSRLEIGNKKMRMIPSFGMVKAFLDTTGSDGYDFTLVLGASSPEDLRRRMIDDNARDIAIHCPEISQTPSIADGHKAPPIDFIGHDIYHTVVSRYVDKSHRKFFCELASIANPDKFEDPVDKSVASKFYSILIDCEFDFYNPYAFGKHDENIIYPAFRYLLAQVDIRIGKKHPQSKLAFQKFAEKLKSMLAIWQLYKFNYTHFNEITDYFEQLDLQSQNALSEDYFPLQDYARSRLPRPITMDELRALKPHEFAKVYQLARVNESGLGVLALAGIPFQKVWQLEPKKREIIVKYSSMVESLMERKIPYQSIVKLNSTLLERVLNEDKGGCCTLPLIQNCLFKFC
jgi:hypothetical protein